MKSMANWSWRRIFCCCSLDSIGTPSNCGMEIEHEYVVEKLVIKKVPVLRDSYPEEANLNKNTERQDNKSFVFSSYHQSSPCDFLFENLKVPECAVDVKKAKQKRWPFSLGGGGDPVAEMYRKKFINNRKQYSKDVGIQSDYFEPDPKYILRKITSDLSNCKEVKWKIIIKPGMNNCSQVDVSSEPSNPFNQKEDLSNLSVSTFNFNTSGYT